MTETLQQSQIPLFFGTPCSNSIYRAVAFQKSVGSKWPPPVEQRVKIDQIDQIHQICQIVQIEHIDQIHQIVQIDQYFYSGLFYVRNATSEMLHAKN